jgi:acetyltransferase-like isoleucine patch superfamily enzyme
MSRLMFRLKLFLKFIKISRFDDFSIGQNSRIGRFSRILFSSDDNCHKNQSISIGSYAGIGEFTELQVWDNNHICIKDYSTLNDGCKILGDVTIEKYCLFSANIFVSSGNHYAMSRPSWLIKDQDAFVLSTEEGQRQHSKPVHIEEDCWIGLGVFVKQGIYIGRGAVIGAHSVVVKDIPPYSIQAGSPSKEIRRRLEFVPPMRVVATIEEDRPYFYRGFSLKQNILMESIKENVIFAGRESIAVLEGGNFASFQVFGKNKMSSTIQLVVLWQGIYEWEVSIPAGRFNLIFEKKAIIKQPENKEASKLYWSLGEDLKKYNIVCFYVKNDMSDNLLGIESLTLNI